MNVSNWIQVGGGAIRFRGRDAMELVIGLIRGDKDYTFQIAREPHCHWVDVYASSTESRDLLIAMVEES